MPLIPNCVPLGCHQGEVLCYQCEDRCDGSIFVEVIAITKWSKVTPHLGVTLDHLLYDNVTMSQANELIGEWLETTNQCFLVNMCSNNHEIQ